MDEKGNQCSEVSEKIHIAQPLVTSLHSNVLVK